MTSNHLSKNCLRKVTLFQYPIDHRNIKILAIKTYKFLKGLSAPILKLL